MLVLTRKCNEQIILPELGVTISILDVRGDKVRVGITAPPETKVYRQEAWSQLQNGNGTAGPHATRSPAWGLLGTAPGGGIDGANFFG